MHIHSRGTGQNGQDILTTIQLTLLESFFCARHCVDVAQAYEVDILIIPNFQMRNWGQRNEVTCGMLSPIWARQSTPTERQEQTTTELHQTTEHKHPFLTSCWWFLFKHCCTGCYSRIKESAKMLPFLQRPKLGEGLWILLPPKGLHFGTSCSTIFSIHKTHQGLPTAQHSTESSNSLAGPACRALPS